MPIEFRCSQCGQLLRVPDEAAGKSARCPKCQALMSVPSVATAVPIGGESPPAFPPPPSSSPAGIAEFGAPAAPPPPGNPFTAAPLPTNFPPPPPTSLAAGSAASGAPAPAEPSRSPFSAAPPSTSFLPPPPKPAAESPFAASGATSHAENPYASPAAAAYAYDVVPGGARPGLPWEYKGHNFPSWWETAKLCMMQPSQAFSIMRLYGGMGSPMLYCGFGLGIGAAANLLWNLPMTLGLMMVGKQQGGADAGVLMGVQLAVQLAQSVMFVLLGATVFLLIGTAITHVCLMMVGGAHQGFETTLRVLAFAQGSTAWLNIIPCAGPLMIFVWVIVLEINGLAQAHQTTSGKAALALFLPLIVIGVCAALFAAVVLGVLFSAKGR